MRITLKHGVNHHEISTCTTVHVTDDTLGKPIAINKAAWFDIANAIEYVREQSLSYPEPNRFIVFDENDKINSVWQCGERAPLFTVVV